MDYEGSIAIDRDLIAAADLLPGEQVHVLNLNNGQRLVTYVIAAAAGSGTMLLNGPAARLGVRGDKVVILAYAAVSADEARRCGRPSSTWTKTTGRSRSSRGRDSPCGGRTRGT